VKYCLFDNNSDGDYLVYDTLARQGEVLTGPALDATNIAADPLFVAGPLGGYYLSQSASGQGVDSPAVNAGSDLASQFDLSDYTTRTDGAEDAENVDIGYHYRDHTDLPLYALTAAVIGGHGTVQPASGTYYAGLPVTVTALPAKGWRVASWSGTVNDASKALTNLVIMGPDRDVSLWLDQPRTIVVGSDPNYTTIQRALDEAVAGDVVILPTGTYDPPYPLNDIEIIDEGVTLTSVNPDDPTVVAATVLRGYRFYVATVDSEAIVDGLTIMNGTTIDSGGNVIVSGGVDIFSCSPTIRNCVFRDCRVWGASPPNNTQDPDDGPNGGSVGGGAMTIINGSPLGPDGRTAAPCTVASIATRYLRIALSPTASPRAATGVMAARVVPARTGPADGAVTGNGLSL